MAIDILPRLTLKIQIELRNTAPKGSAIMSRTQRLYA
jgi:hypothetical protein